MLKRMIQTAVLFALSSLTLFGADFMGQWTSARPVQVIALKTDGAKITGTVQSYMGSLRIGEVKINGNDITLTLYVLLSGGNDPLGLAGYDAYAEEGQVRELTYKGTLVGDELRMKISQEGLEEVRNLVFKKNAS
jgi:hypothetical protein